MIFLDISIGLKDDAKEGLTKKMDEYATSFTVHGISRIYNGNVVEKIVWSVFVLTAVVGSVIVINNHVQRYLKHEVIQSFTSETTNRAYFPQVTFCLDNLRFKLLKLHCGVEFSKIVNYTECKNDELDCSVPKRKIKGAWSNGLFSVIDMRLGNEKYNRSFAANHLDGHERDTKGACVTWHFNKTFYQVLSTVSYSDFSIKLAIAEDLIGKYKKELTVIINEQNVSGIYQRAQLHLVPEFSYDLMLSKTVTYRKEKPFPSNCSNRTNINTFPGIYNQETCFFLSSEINVFKKYRITRDVTRHFIPNNIRSKYKKNWQHDVNGFQNAFKEFFRNIDPENSNCPLPCHEVTYGFSVISKPTNRSQQPVEFALENADTDEATGKQCFNLEIGKKSAKFFIYELHLHYKNPNLFTKIEEKELYPRDEMLGEVGGFLGLMIGASCISLLELMAFVMLALIKKCCK